MSESIAHRQVALLRVADARVLEEIRALVPLEDFALAVVSPTEVVIDPARLGELAQRLSDRGISPLMKRLQGPDAQDLDRLADTTDRMRRLR